MTKHEPKTIARRLGALAILTLIPLGMAPVEATDHCVRAQVPQAFVMPDGSERQAGDLRLCMSEEFTPIAGLHRSYIDGQFAGMYLSRMGSNEEDAPATPYLMFRRAEEGRWILLGYAVPAAGSSRVYRMQAIGPREPRVSTTIKIAEAEPVPAHDDDTHESAGKVILLAALID